jgi:hypothetical protein
MLQVEIFVIYLNWPNQGVKQLKTTICKQQFNHQITRKKLFFVLAFQIVRPSKSVKEFREKVDDIFFLVDF